MSALQGSIGARRGQSASSRRTASRRRGANTSLRHCASPSIEKLEKRWLSSAPNAPDSLYALTVSTDQVNLTWKDNSNNEDGFEIDYSTSSTFSSNVKTVAAGVDTGSKWITGLAASEQYFFRVRASNADGDSSNSTTVEANTPAEPTGGTTVTVAGFTRDDIIDAIEASDDGYTIVFPSGTYNLSSRVTLPGGGRVYKGATTLTTNSGGTTSYSDGPVFVSSGTEPVFDFVDDSEPADDGMYNIRITGLTFDGRGLFLHKEGGTAGFPVRGVVVDNCRFDVTNYGIHTSTGVRDTVIINNLFNPTDGLGINFYSGGDATTWNHLIIANNEFKNGGTGMHLDNQNNPSSATDLLVEQNYLSGLHGIGVEIQGGGSDTIVQDNYYEDPLLDLNNDANNASTFAYSVINDRATDPMTRRNYATAPTSTEQFHGVRYMYEIGGFDLDMYDNYSDGGNRVIEVTHSTATGVVHDNRIQNYRLGPASASQDVIFNNNNASVQLTWDHQNCPKPGPHRRVFGLAISSGALTAKGTKLQDTISVTTSGSNRVITVNSEPFIYPSGSLSSVTINGAEQTDTITVNNTSTMPVIIAPSAGDDSVNVNTAGSGSALVRFDATQRIGQLTIGDGGVATLPEGANKVLTLTGITIDEDGRLDLNDNDMIVKNIGISGLATITAYLKSGLENGSSFDWLGAGIGSTSASEGNTGSNGFLYALGVLWNDLSQVGGGGPIYEDFSGQSVTEDDVLVKFTWFGDADLSGSIDATDYSLIDNGYVNGLSGWIHGDFDYSGVIDATDYALIDNAYVNQTGPLFAGGEPDNVYSAAAEQLFDEWAEKYELLSPQQMIELHTKLFGDAYTDALALVQSGKLR